MRNQHLNHSLRTGFSLLELQVALILFGIAFAGLIPLVVMQSKQLKKIEGRFHHQTTYYLVPTANPWAGKLGAAASVTTEAPASGAPPPVMVIDDGDPGYTESGYGWSSSKRDEAFHQKLRKNVNGNGSAKAHWQFAGLEAGWYEVLVTWAAKDSQASDAPYTIYDGQLAKGTVRVNQTVKPAGKSFDGLGWKSLGLFAIQGDTLLVELSDQADGMVVADGVRIARVENEVRVLSLDKSLTREEVTAHVLVTVRVPQ